MHFCTILLEEAITLMNWQKSDELVIISKWTTEVIVFERQLGQWCDSLIFHTTYLFSKGAKALALHVDLWWTTHGYHGHSHILVRKTKPHPNKKYCTTCMDLFQQSLGTTCSNSPVIRNPVVSIHEQHEYDANGDLKQQFHGVQCCKITSLPSPHDEVILMKDLDSPSTSLPVERWIDRGWRFGGPRNSSARAVENWIKDGWPLLITTFDSIFTDRSVHSPHPP